MKSTEPKKNRLASIDILRGFAIILMALDHTRDYFGPVLFDPMDLSNTSITLFLTRWITHLAAPIFVFLTGVGVYLSSHKKTPSELSALLIKRGLWLIILDITLVSFSWTFDFGNIVLIQILWVIGWSMIILAGLIWLPMRVILFLSVIVIAGHNFFDSAALNSHATLFFLYHFLHVPFDFSIKKITFFVAYPLVPWPAVMALGYYVGTWFKEPMEIRNKRFFYLGISCLILFVFLRYSNIYGDPTLWQIQPRGNFYTILSFINLTKYPPSLLFLLVTLGISFTIWPLIEKWHGFGSQLILCYGQVPMFFYLVHLPIIHGAAIFYDHVFLHSQGGWWFNSDSPIAIVAWPSNYHFNLGLVYVAWFTTLVVTYPLCLVYRNFKTRHAYWWLYYL